MNKCDLVQIITHFLICLSDSPLPARTKGGRAAKRGVTVMLCVQLHIPMFISTNR